MAFYNTLTAGIVMLACLLGTAMPAQAGSRLNEKSIIKKLIFKKKTRRTTTQQPKLRRKSTTRTITVRPVIRKKKTYRTIKKVTRKRTKILKDPVTISRKRRVTRRKKTTIRKSVLTRAERRSKKRRKTLRRILTAKRRNKSTFTSRPTTTTKRRTRRSKRGIAFPAPAVEIVDSGSSNVRQTGNSRPGTTRPSNKRTNGGVKKTKWANTTPSTQRKRKKNVWRKSTTRPATTPNDVYVEDSDDPYGSNEPRTVRVATTRLQRDQIKSIVDAEGLPQIDIEIYFDYNSASIRPRSMPDVGVLGRALRNEQLAGAQFMIIGHTDATGGDSYNLRLSEERAHAVRNFLVNVFGLDGGRFYPMGYGEEQLKRTDRPDHAENRRVQIVNIGGGQQ